MIIKSLIILLKPTIGQIPIKEEERLSNVLYVSWNMSADERRNRGKGPAIWPSARPDNCPYRRRRMNGSFLLYKH